MKQKRFDYVWLTWERDCQSVDILLLCTSSFFYCNICSTKKLFTVLTVSEGSLALKQAVCCLIVFVVHDQNETRYVISGCCIFFFIYTQSENSQFLSPKRVFMVINNILFLCNRLFQYVGVSKSASSHFSLPCFTYIDQTIFKNISKTYQLKPLTATCDREIFTSTVV